MWGRVKCIEERYGQANHPCVVIRGKQGVNTKESDWPAGLTDWLTNYLGWPVTVLVWNASVRYLEPCIGTWTIGDASVLGTIRRHLEPYKEMPPYKSTWIRFFPSHVNFNSAFLRGDRRYSLTRSQVPTHLLIWFKYRCIVTSTGAVSGQLVS